MKQSVFWRSVAGATWAIGMALGVGSAAAVPFSVGGVLSGERNGDISASLIDTAIVGLEGADVRLRFDPDYLIYVASDPGSAIDGFVMDGVPAPADPSEVLISLASNIGPINGSGPMLVSRFKLRPDSPVGVTSISFESYSLVAGLPSAYDIPLTEGVVTVNASAVPATATLALLVAGLAALALTRRREGGSSGMAVA